MNQHDIPVINITTLDSIFCVLEDVANNTITEDTRNLAIALMNSNIENRLIREIATTPMPAYAR